MLNSGKRKMAQDLRTGDEFFFNSLYRFFFPKLDYFANQYLMDPETSRGIVQDVFAELWSRRKTFADDDNIHAWLFTVTKNKTLSYIRKIKSQQNYLGYLKGRQLEVNYRSLEVFETNDLIFEELQQQIDAALLKLTPACRKVFIMSRFEELKNREIADQLGLSVKTVEVHISNGLKILRSELKDYLPLMSILLIR